MRFSEQLSKTPVLWFSFIATLVSIFAMSIIAKSYDFALLDTISSPDKLRSAIAGMSQTNRAVHAWVTGTLDVLFPIAYGALFIGSAYKFFPKSARLLSAPIVLLVVVDLCEGVVQILGLIGAADWLVAKSILTPVKFLLFFFGLLFTVNGWAPWIIERYRSGSSAR